MATGALGLLALVPAMIGTSSAGSSTVAIDLCSGDSIAITFYDDDAPAPPRAPDCAKGCHGASPRKRNGRSA